MAIQPETVVELIQNKLTGAQVNAIDLTGTLDHYKVIVVAKEFEGLRLIQRHQLINEALKEPLTGPLHALSIEAHTPTEWANKTPVPQGIKL